MSSISLEQYAEGFRDEPGYLDFARIGPVGRTVRDEEAMQSSILGRARFGTLDQLDAQDARVREAVARVLRTSADRVVFQPNTSQGLMHVMFGISGQVLVSTADFPSLTFAATRASAAIGRVEPVWFTPDHARITPGAIRDVLTPDIETVGISLVDFRTGHLVDLEGIRDVVGDRLLVVDSIQGFGVVDAPWELADVVVSGGQKWVRAGGGTGFMALSDRALSRIQPVFSGFSATDADGTPLDEVLPPTAGARAFQVSNPDRVAEARLAAALEELEAVGVQVISDALTDRVERIIDLADEFGIEVLSPRAVTERAGIVVLDPGTDRLTTLTAALHNHGVTATVRAGSVRLSPHVTTDEETFAMLRSSMVSFGTSGV